MIEINDTHAKSVCTCGHTGDGPRSEHAGLIGHGACQLVACACEKFTWRRWASASDVAGSFARVNLGWRRARGL